MKVIGFIDDDPLTLTNVVSTFSGSENPILRLVSEVRKEGNKIRVISAYDVDAIVASGVLIKYLLQSDVRYEFITVLDVDHGVLTEDVPIISFDTQFKDLRRGVCVVRGERSEIRKLGNGFLLTTPYYSYMVLKALEDVMIVTNDVRYFVLTSMLSRYVPRIKAHPLDDSVRGFIKELTDLNLLKVVSGLKVFNYSLVDVEKALNRSLDIFIPGVGGVGVDKGFKGLSEEELSKAVLNRILTFSQQKFSTNDLVGDNYIINQDWFFRDAYEFLYALMIASDLYGAHYLVASMLIPNYIPLIRLKYEKVVDEVASAIYKVKEAGMQQIKKNVYKVRLDSLTALTPISKVFKSYVVPANSIIIYEYSNELYTSLLDNTLEAITSLIRGSYEVVGGLMKFKELKSP